MPRKAAAALAVVPRIPGQGRPPPPADLDPVERRIWSEVVDALPGHWLDPAGQVLLRRLAAQAAVAEQLELRLRQTRAEGRADSKAVIEHGAVSVIVARLLAELRATPKSQLRGRAAGSRAEQAPQMRPWEIRGGEAQAKSETH